MEIQEPVLKVYSLGKTSANGMPVILYTIISICLSGKARCSRNPGKIFLRIWFPAEVAKEHCTVRCSETIQSNGGVT